MVHSRTSSLDDTFFALSHPIRRAMLGRLAEGKMSVKELAKPFELTGGAISKHLRVLKKAGLLEQQRAGLGRECSIDTEPLREVIDWLKEYQDRWAQQLDSFVHYAADHAKNKRKHRAERK